MRTSRKDNRDCETAGQNEIGPKSVMGQCVASSRLCGVAHPLHGVEARVSVRLIMSAHDVVCSTEAPPELGAIILPVHRMRISFFRMLTMTGELPLSWVFGREIPHPRTVCATWSQTNAYNGLTIDYLFRILASVPHLLEDNACPTQTPLRGSPFNPGVMCLKYAEDPRH